MTGENSISFQELKWDTQFFGVTCAKAVLNRQLTKIEWDELKNKFTDFQFVSIINKNSITANAKLIGTDTTAFLADVNIQFKKAIKANITIPDGIVILEAMERDDRILKIGDFQFSKFTGDRELAKRGGNDVYRQWIINSFGKKDKFFAINKDLTGDINGFVLFSYTEKNCIIELISVSSKLTGGGIGVKLFSAVEAEAFRHGCDEIIVGTQMQNLRAINFYHKCGCKQVGCHQVYHLWNL